MSNQVNTKNGKFSMSPLGWILLPLVVIMAIWGCLCLAAQKATTDVIANTAIAKARLAEEDKKYDEDKRFLSIKSQLAHHWSWGDKSYAPLEPTESAGSHFLETLYRFTPEYGKYTEAKQAADLSKEAALLNDEEFNYFEFNQTCNFVDALKAGDSAKAKISGNGSGWTSANFVTDLKGCGDTNLVYLDQLKALHPGH